MQIHRRKREKNNALEPENFQSIELMMSFVCYLSRMMRRASVGEAKSSVNGSVFRLFSLSLSLLSQHRMFVDQIDLEMRSYGHSWAHTDEDHVSQDENERKIEK